MLNDLTTAINANTITLPTSSYTLFLADNDNYFVITDPDTLMYHVLVGGAKTLTDFDNNLDTQNLVSQTGPPYRIVKYGKNYYINGFSKILYGPVQLADCTVFIIEKPLVVPSAANASCVTCYKPTLSVSADINTTASLFSSILTGFTLNNPPYTYLINDNNVYSVQQNNDWEISYFLSNTTARDAYLKKYIVQGSIYPVAASVKSMTTLDGTVITFSNTSDSSISLFFGNNSLAASVSARSDGVYYSLSPPVGAIELIPVSIPPAPTPPGFNPITPITPMAPTFRIPTIGSSVINSFNLVLFLTLFLLLIIQ